MTRVQRLVRDQIADAIDQDLENGEALMKECYEQMSTDAQLKECYAEMRAIREWILRDHDKGRSSKP